MTSIINRKINTIDSRLAVKLILTVVMMILAFTMLLPFFYMMSQSLKREIDIFTYPIQWIPSNPVNNYQDVWFGYYNFSLYYFNSIKIAFLSVSGTLVTSSLAAYAFTKLKFKGRDTIFLLYLATMMIPPQVLLVPRFILFKYLGIYNTHAALVLPAVFNAFGIFLLRQFMLSIPTSLNEAAKIDGASEFRIWLEVIVPLTKPIMATLALLALVTSWNDYQNALVFLTTSTKYTVPLGLLNFIDETGKQYSLIMAAAVSSALPPIIAFLFGQKFIIEGITAGAVKG